MSRHPSALNIIASVFAAMISPMPPRCGGPLAGLDLLQPRCGGPLSGLDLLPPVSDIGRDPNALHNLTPADRAEIRAEILREGGIDLGSSATRLAPHGVKQ